MQVGLKCTILRTKKILPDNWQLSLSIVNNINMLVTKFIVDRADLVSSGGGGGGGGVCVCNCTRLHPPGYGPDVPRAQLVLKDIGC